MHFLIQEASLPLKTGYYREDGYKVFKAIGDKLLYDLKKFLELTSDEIDFLLEKQYNSSSFFFNLLWFKA